MRLIFCAALMLNLWVSLPCLAQEINPDPESAVSEDASTSTEPEQALSTQFDLVENSAIDSKIHDLLKNHVSVLNRPADKITSSELRLLRFSVRREIANILATEGYFSPLINFDVQIKKSEKILVHIKVELGPVTKVTTAQVNFVGDAVPPELQQSIQSNWGLQKGATFRDDDWSHAKTKALESLTEHSYAAAKITDSQATIQDQQADLSVLLDSGPVFRIGELRIQGLNLYKPWLLDRYHPPVTGDVYSRESLLKFQRTLQNSPYFSSVSVSVDPDPEVAAAVPVEVLVKERQEHDVGLGAGYSTNTGARGEVSYRDRDFVGDAYDLRSVLRIEQLRQIGYADIYLPPRLSGYLDSFGVLFDRSDISGLLTATSSFGAKRVITEDSVERRLGLSFVYEQSTVSGDEETHAKALVSSIGWTWRAVNNVFEPRQGQITQLDISGATKHLISDQNFLRLYGKYQRWIPVATRDVIILRIEAGYVLAADSVGIPEDYLFRAGGTASVRGYSYQSLGVNQADGVVGGRVLTTATAEYVHWLEANWGVAGFVDVGDAADHVSDLSLKQGIGMGLRYKTPAGPIALDLAYGRQTEKLRLDFSIGIAF